MTLEGTTAPMVNLYQSMTRFMLNNISQTLQQTKTMLNSENCQKRILDANYTPINIEEFTNGQDHLSNLEKEMLMKLLQANSTLFEVGLGTIKMDPVLLEINTNNDGFKPFSDRAYPIPRIHYDTTEKEINRLVKLGIGVLRACSTKDNSEWGAPTFIIPKKTGDVQVVTDIRQLNKMLNQKSYPTPNIPDLLQSLNGLKYSAAIDLSMGYYHLSLCPKSQEYCTVV
jgi:hypothetical protein